MSLTGLFALGMLVAWPASANANAPFSAPEVKAKPRVLVKRNATGYGSEGSAPNIAQIAAKVGDNPWDDAPIPQFSGATNRPGHVTPRTAMPHGATPHGMGAGTPDPPGPTGPPRTHFSPPRRHDPIPQRNLLKALGSLVNRPIHRISDTARLFQRRALLRRVARSMPDLSTDPSGIRLEGARDSQLLTLAPGALQRFERRIDVLHMLGVRHNNIRPENIVIDRYGELQLVDWERAGKGGDAEGDLLGVDAVRRFLQQRLGS